MSMLEGGVPCEVDTENNDTVHPESVQTVQNTNAPSCHVEETDNDNELLKGLLTDTFCQVCEAVLLFESQRVSHYEGKKHAQRVRIYLQTKKAERIKQSQANSSFQSGNVNPEKFCELCNMVFSSPVVARSHYEGKVHAKNMRKSDTTPSTDIKTTAGSVALPVPAREGATGDKEDQEQKESALSPAQEVNLNDPDKYCKLCTASFNNPVMAQQHYSGRKHQRNQARQEMLSKLSSESDNANSLTCPVCCVTLSSVETYQAHMQGNKHFVQEKKIVGLCKSQKKMYDSFQDELADYIQVQKARGLEPKTGPGSETHGKAEEDFKESEQFEEEPKIPPPSSHLPPPPPLPPSFRPPRWRPPFQPRTGRFGFRGRFPVQHQWVQAYPPHPPPLIPGLTGRSLRRGRSPDSFSSSSSSSDSSSYSSSTCSSSSSESSSDSSRDRRRRIRKRKERMKRRREQDDDANKDERRRSKRRRRREGEEEQGHTKKAGRERRMSFEEEQGTDEEKERRKWKEKRHREGDSSEEDDYRSKRRVSKKNKRQKEGHSGKRRREEDEEERSKESLEKELVGEEGGVQSEGVQATAVEHTEERTELREEKSKRKKEKKKVKEKMDEGDNRTEEEKLWDETILGIF